MRDLSLSLSLTKGISKTKNTASVYRLNLAILSSTALIVLAYLFVINSLGTKGYEIRKLESQMQLLTEQHKTLEMQTSDLQSITRIQSKAQLLNFVPNTNATYLKDSDFALK